MPYCKYYQANIREKDCWFFTAIIRSMEHLEFNRTLDPKTGLFEFFVPEDRVDLFLQVTQYFIDLGTVYNLKELPNRLMDPSANF